MLGPKFRILQLPIDIFCFFEILGCQDRRFECQKPDPGTEFSRCLRLNLTCDNIPHCHDDSDEASCPGMFKLVTPCILGLFYVLRTF